MDLRNDSDTHQKPQDDTGKYDCNQLNAEAYR